MSLLFPAMLAGLAALAVPIALHLIARHRFPVQNFPSIRLLQKDVRTNVFAPRLVDVPQLLLRLLVLTLLVLAMSRLLVFGAGSGEAPRNLVVVLDASAGMRLNIAAENGQKVSLLDRAREEARGMIEALKAPGQCAVVVLAEKATVAAPLESETEAARAAIGAAESIDGVGCGVVRGVATACALLDGRREIASQIVVLTDMRSNAFSTRDSKDLARIDATQKSLNGQLQIVFVDVSNSARLENVGIVDASIRGGVARVGDDVHVLTRVVNSGSEKTMARLRLEIGDRKEPQAKEIALEPGAEAVVDMTTRVQRPANSVATVSVAADAASFDDAFSVPLNIADTRRVLIVNGVTAGAATPAPSGSPLNLTGGTAPSEEPAEAESGLDGATILRYVLNPGRELGAAYGTGIDVSAVTADGLAGQTLSKFDVIVLYDVSQLPDTTLDDLVTFVREGRSVVIFSAGRCQPLSFNRTLAAGTARRPALSPAQIGTDLALPQAVELKLAGNTHPLLTPFRDRLQGDLSIIRFSKLREVQAFAEGTSAVLTASSGQPLAVEQTLGRGRVMLFTFGLELERGNIARARAFPALMWRLIGYLTGQLRQRPPDVVRAMTPAVLDVSDPAFSFADEVELRPAEKQPQQEGPGNTKTVGPFRMPCSPERTVLVPPLRAGKYVLSKATKEGDPLRGGYTRYVAAAVDSAESYMQRQDEGELKGLFSGNVRVMGTQEIPSLALPGRELWRSLAVLLAFAYLGESILGYVLSRRRERERATTGGLSA
jgi:hypothetical protein